MVTEAFEVTIDGFSGPLDLLCHLVESRQMQASQIKVTQLVRIYGAYLSKTRKASVDVLAEFFFMAAELLLQKTLSLLPTADNQDSGYDEMEDLPIDEDELLEKLARYRPYRVATTWLEDRKRLKERSFRRLGPDTPHEEPIYDIGDLFFLSRVWWGLFERFSQNQDVKVFDFEESFEEWKGMPEALPEESQIQSRIAELEEKLKTGEILFLNTLWSGTPSVKLLVVTLLAVLEMCRMGKVYIEQEKLFSDVKICAKR